MDAPGASLDAVIGQPLDADEVRGLLLGQPQRAAAATQAQTTAAAQGTAPPAPARTTPARPPAPPASTAPASCHPLSNEGTCYEPGEFCRKTDHGESGVAGDGKAIKCEDNDGWRWEPV